MSNHLPSVNGKAETERIVAFLHDIFVNTGKRNAIIGWSGGIDSTVSLYLLARALPLRHIHVVHMPYTTSHLQLFEVIQKSLNIPQDNVEEFPIKDVVDEISRKERIGQAETDRVRLGNIMARVRMMHLFDKARVLDGLVCGTENRSEHLLGYYTRFGDGASDIEPIIHLYKTQVYELAAYLGVPKVFLTAIPSAGLWEGQTDEGEFGFSYREADAVLYLSEDRRLNPEEIKKAGFTHTDAILAFKKSNAFKQEVPYSLAG